MNKILRIAAVSLSVAGLVACATTDDRAMQASPQTNQDPDAAYIGMVERIALRRGIQVTWVNPPTVERAPRTTNHD